MKKLFAVVLILALALCGCAQKPEDKNSSVFSNEESSVVSTSSNVLSIESETSTSSFSEFTKVYSKWTTLNCVNSLYGGYLYYDQQSDTFYYQKAEVKDSDNAFCLVSNKDGVERIISREAAKYIYVLDNKIYFTNGKEIVRINTDGSEREVLTKAEEAQFIYPYKDDVYYCTNYEAKLHKISPDGTDRIVETGDKLVHYYMIYEDKIYYAGFPDLSISTNLYSLDIETGEEKLLFDELVYGAEVINDKIYFISENDEMICCNLDGSNRQKLVSGCSLMFFVYSDRLIYFPRTGIDIKEYSFRTGQIKTVGSSDDGVWYRCNDEFIASVTDDGKITKVDI